MEISNVDWLSVDMGQTNNTFIYLRGDYGSTWEGDIIAKDVRIKAADPEAFSLMYHSYQNFKYGYICTVPNLDFDGIKIEGIENGATVPVMTERASVLKDPALHLPVTSVMKFEFDDGTTTNDNYNPVCPPKYFKIKNADYRFIVTNSDFFKNSVLEGVEKVEVDEYVRK
jgi:hypothetical protein